MFCGVCVQRISGLLLGHHQYNRFPNRPLPFLNLPPRGSNCPSVGGGGVDAALWLDPHPQPKKGSIDRTPKILPRLPGGDLDPKYSKKMKWDFWNQWVQGIQKSHHLPCIW